MDWLIQAAGAALMLLALVDVFLTVLYARSGAGLITPRLNRLSWRLMRAAAPSQGPGRDKFLSFGGPLLLVLSVGVWAVLLFCGAALIAWPELGTGIQDTSGRTETDFSTALYYGGYSLTTLGTGNLVPRTDALEVLMVVQALVGFSFVTLTLTYFMSVYAALLRRNKLAQALHHLSAGSGDAAEILIRLGPAGDFRAGSGQLADIGLDVIDLLESHHLYPVLHYFRMTDSRYAMSRMSLLALDTACLAQTALGPEHRNFAQSTAVQMLWGSSLDLLQDTAKTFLPANASERSWAQQEKEESRQHFRAAVRKLSERGIETCEDEADAEDAYIALRSKWILLVRAFAELGGYRWQEISSGSPQGSIDQRETPRARD